MNQFKKVALAVIVAAGLGMGLYYQDVRAAAGAMENDKSALYNKLTTSIENYKEKSLDPNAGAASRSINSAMQKVLETIRTLVDKFSGAAEKTLNAVKGLASAVINIVKYNANVVGSLGKGVANTISVGIGREKKLFEEQLIENLVRHFIGDFGETNEKVYTVGDLAILIKENQLDAATMKDMAVKLYADALNRLEMLETFKRDVFDVLMAQLTLMKTKATEAAEKAGVKLPKSVTDALDSAVPQEGKTALASLKVKLMGHLAQRRKDLEEIGYFLGIVTVIPAELQAKLERQFKLQSTENEAMRNKKEADYAAKSAKEAKEMHEKQMPSPSLPTQPAEDTDWSDLEI